MSPGLALLLQVKVIVEKVCGYSKRCGLGDLCENALGRMVVHGRWNSPQTVMRHYIRPATTLGPDTPLGTIL